MDLTNGARRRFIGALATTGAAAMLPRGLFAQAPPTHRIDVHQHFVSPSYYAMLTRRNTPAAPVPGFAAWRDYTPARVIENLDSLGIRTAMLSITAPGVWFGDVNEARSLAREMNEYAAARMVGDHKGRFGLFAVLPLPDVEGSLREIEYAFDTLKADGVGVLSSYDDRWLGDKAFAPVWEELNRRKAVVYTHATAPGCCTWDFQPGILPTYVELGSDLARAMVSIIQSGTAKRTPDVRYIWSHGGGSIWAQRFITGETVESLARPAPPDSRLYHFRRFHYDTAAAADAIHIGILKLVVSPSQIVFGSDYPWGDPVRIVAGLQTSGFTPQELQAVYRDNALALMPQLRG
jgi:6-methylsalicylate decarboxylase